MANNTVSQESSIKLALANAKRLRRDARHLVIDLARILEQFQNEQSEEDTSDGTDDRQY